VREIVCRNQRASHTLRDAALHSDWLAVSLEGFGRHSPTPVNGLLTIGDAASFIDPFTGSGMLMALESGELVANTIMRHLPQLNELQLQTLSEQYRAAYERQFNSRLRLCSMIRRAAFAPGSPISRSVFSARATPCEGESPAPPARSRNETSRRPRSLNRVPRASGP